VYLPYLMLRTLTPWDMTAAQQREADEQLGEIAAAASRCSRRAAARTLAVATMPVRRGRQPADFRNNGSARRAPRRA
jgi:hypothetical protein